MSNFIKNVSEHAVYFAEFMGIIAAAFVVAYLFEKIVQKRNGDTERILTTRKLVVIGVFSAISFILYLLELPVFFAAPFYKMDFSELPALIGAYAFGPVTGVLIEFIKILLKLCTKGTSTAFVGDLANFCVGCSFILPASILYHFKKSRKMALISCLVGTLCMTIFGSLFNAVYLLPTFAVLYGMPMDSLIAMGTAVNASITDLTTFVVLSVAPMNLMKGTLISVITVLVYKKLSPILKSAEIGRRPVKSPVQE